MQNRKLSRIAGGTLATLLALPSLAAAQSQDPQSYLLLAQDGIRVKRLTLRGGNLAVIGPRGTFASPGGLDAGAGEVAASRIRLDGAATCGALFGDDVRGATATCGPAEPFEAPFARLEPTCGFPDPFPACAPQKSRVIPKGQEVALPPGAYGDVRVDGGANSPGRLVLAGSYTFCSLNVSGGGSVTADGPTTLHVRGSVTTSSAVRIGPAAGSGLEADALQLFVAGSRVRLSRGSVVEAHLCAPHARVNARAASLAGRLVAFAIRAKDLTASISPTPPATTTSTTTTPTTSTTSTTDACSAQCGDGEVDAACGEVCDGDIACSSAAGALLRARGTGGSACGAFGTDCSLDCAADCKSFTTAPCGPTTTTTTLTPPTSSTTSSSTTTTTTTSSTTSTTDACATACGNHVIDAECGEQCDGSTSCDGAFIGATATSPGGAFHTICGDDCRIVSQEHCPASSSTTTTTTNAPPPSTTSTTSIGPVPAPSSTTTTTTLPAPVEQCGNCRDDDGDGDVDLEDTDCCDGSSAFGAIVQRAQIRTRPRGNLLRLRSVLADGGLRIDPRADEVSLVISSGDRTQHLCATVPARVWKKRQRTWRFSNKRPRLESLQGIDDIRLQTRRTGRLRYRAKGKKVLLAGALGAGNLRITVGFHDTTGSGAGNRCARATKPFRAIKQGGVRFP